jgi:hypothetical protein
MHERHQKGIARETSQMKKRKKGQTKVKNQVGQLKVKMQERTAKGKNTKEASQMKKQTKVKDTVGHPKVKMQERPKGNTGETSQMTRMRGQTKVKL